MDTYFDDDLRGFTPKNLEILSKEMAGAGIDLQYQVYSRNDSMNVTTRYAQNHRMFLDGNFRICTDGLPELWLTSFDVINNRIDTTPTELKNFHSQLLKRIINFAEKIGIYKVDYTVFQDDKSRYRCISTEQDLQICKELGFKVNTRYGASDFQRNFEKILAHD